MPEHVGDLPLHTTQHAAFALPCAVPRAIAYLGDPAVLLSALPSVERVIERHCGTFRITLAPVQIPGLSLRPAAEIAFITEPGRVRIESTPAEPHALQAGEIATHITGVLIAAAARSGSSVRATLAIDAKVPGTVVPALMPRIIAQRTAEAVLTHRMKQEVTAMTRTLVQGYIAWEAANSASNIRHSE